MRRVLFAPLLVLTLACPAYPAQEPPGATAGLANPAAMFCRECGGTLQLVDTPAGQSENCVLPFFGALDEWTWWRLFHPQ